MRLRSLATATALAVAVVPFLTSSALSADTTVGEAVVPVPSSGSCGGATFVPTGTSGTSSYSVPSDGVITSWRTTVLAGNPAVTRTFKLARPDLLGGGYTFAAPTVPLTIPASSTVQTVSQSIRVPARTGDRLGVYFPASNDTCGVVTSNSVDSFDFYPGNPEGTVPKSGQGAGVRFSMAATLEPDADGDGFGDTTQDKCPTNATTQGTCPVAPVTTPVKDTAAPQTTVVSAKAAKAKIKAAKPGQKTKLRKANVTVAFAADETSTYTCSVDGGAFTACASPFTAKLKKGTHTIAVRATDAAGNVDTTPATTTVTVKKAKNKKNKKNNKKKP